MADTHAGEAVGSVRLASALASANSFTDVPPEHRFHAAISWAAAEGITVGYPDGTFRPGEDVTRQAMVAFLYRLAGEPDDVDGAGFSDVPGDHTFRDAIGWAAAEGITVGYPDGTFRPDDAVSRQASVAFLHRFTGEPDPSYPAGFLDVPPDHLFHAAIAWAVEQGVTTGYPDGYFRPGETVTRQAAAAFLYRAQTGADTRQADPHPDIIDTSDREAVAAAYEERTAVINTPAGWTGSHEDCDAGEHSDASKSAAFRMVNYYRALAGLPPVRITTEWDRELQAGALTVSTGGWLTHDPEPSRPCYTELGAQGAANSNLAQGSAASAVLGFMTDHGSSNRAVGHRRWLLWPRAGVVGTGATDRVTALRIRSDSLSTRPAHPEWVAWPPEGYLAWPDMPLESVFQGSFHWSLSSNAHPDADFSSATVTMTMGDEQLVVTTYEPEPHLDNTLVWNVQRQDDRAFNLLHDAEFTVRVDGIRMPDGRTESHTYRVHAFTPDDWW